MNETVIDKDADPTEINENMQQRDRADITRAKQYVEAVQSDRTTFRCYVTDKVINRREEKSGEQENGEQESRKEESGEEESRKEESGEEESRKEESGKEENEEPIDVVHFFSRFCSFWLIVVVHFG